MAVNTYEILFLLDPNKFSADPDGGLRQVNGIVEQYGGEIVFTRPWGEPKLAYPVKNFKKGAYVLTYFKADSLAIPKIEHDCRINEMILRHLVIRLHAKIADQVIQHVSGPPVEREARDRDGFEGREGRRSRDDFDRGPRRGRDDGDGDGGGRRHRDEAYDGGGRRGRE
ncbi:30S ribosomal protein S6 [bacterium]|nr:30S ribosomal protein S6 [bacterium]